MSYTPVLQQYFQHCLVKAGFPDDLEVEYSLNHCQGDGVAFYGKLQQDEIIPLFNAMYPQKRKQNMFKKLLEHILAWQVDGYDSMFEIERNAFGYRYSHSKTMSLSGYTSADLDFFNDREAQKAWYFPAGKAEKYKAIWDDFIHDLENHIQETSLQMETAGYQIIEASPCNTETVFKFETENYSVALTRNHYAFYNEPVDWIFGDLSDFEATIEDVIHGKLCYADYKATVTDRHSGITLGKSEINGLSYASAERFLHGYRKEIVREAIKMARKNVLRFNALHA